MYVQSRRTNEETKIDASGGGAWANVEEHGKGILVWFELNIS